MSCSSSFLSDRVIGAIIREMRKPRLICICGGFFADYEDWDLDFLRCGNCQGWMSEERIVDENIAANEQ